MENFNKLIPIDGENGEKRTISSLEIAELTGKQHSNVMRDIRNLLSQGVAESNFGLGPYTDANGQERPLFNLTPKGCLILASGYDAVLREKIIDRFQKGDSVMVNATQMAKSFGKEPKFWLMNQSTTDYLNELSKVRNLTLTDLVQVTKGGNNPGTWMHEDVALEFLSTLSAVRIIPLTGLVDKAFKKILFSFGSLRNCCTFAVLQVDRIIYLAEQAVKLLIFYMGIFYAHTLGYWRLPIRKLLCALRSRLSTCSSVYGNRFLFAYCLHK